MINKSVYMCLFSLIIAFAMVSCKDKNNSDPDSPGTYHYVESTENFANPERGFFVQHYYESGQLSDELTVEEIKKFRAGEWKSTLFLHSYYMTSFMNGDISQPCLDRLARNMETLRKGGSKCVLRFAYSTSAPEPFKPNPENPTDPKPEIVARHIEQLKPYLQEYADVIFCMQAGFIGTWGEWYYTTYFNFMPDSPEKYEPRWKVAEQLMDALPATRQICFRYPGLKRTYCSMRGLSTSPLTEAEAYKGTIRSRWAAHNDAFVSSANDLGTYKTEEDRTFLSQDTRYTVNGGESAASYYGSRADLAIKQLEDYHWTYINMGYHPAVIKKWKDAGKIEEIRCRLGYRLVLDKAVLTPAPVSGGDFTAKLTIRNVGFAAPVNERMVELIFVSTTNAADKHVFKQEADPRFWMGGETTTVQLNATLANMKGEYNVYLNLPDPYPTLHDKPEFSIRLANENVWEEKTGYNKLATITIK